MFRNIYSQYIKSIVKSFTYFKETIVVINRMQVNIAKDSDKIISVEL